LSPHGVKVFYFYGKLKPQMILAPNTVLGHYRLVEKIGEGGMGVVWKARDLRLDRDVAIKFLEEGPSLAPERKAELEREARAVAALRHPNIVTIYSIDEAEGMFFYTMELIEGTPLSKLVVPGGLEFDRLLAIAFPLTEAVAAAHDRGIIHRDLKPGNIMIEPDGTLKILDFGLARFVRPVLPFKAGGNEDTATVDSDLSGTLCYMSPEQIRGEAVDHRTDLFSFGVVLFELATGVLPFCGNTAADMISSILRDESRSAVEANPRLPAAIDRIFRDLLEKDSRARVSSARSLRDSLEMLRRESTTLKSEEIPSIAVLPFADMSPETDQTYFCEGIAEEIIIALGRVQKIRVASRTASFPSGGIPAGGDPREIGRRLNVGTLLEGSVRKAGNRLRISVQLLDAAHGFQLWSEVFDREHRDIFAIQEEIARNVVRALQVTLSPQENGALGKTSTRHVQAYDYYLRARRFYYRYAKRDIEFALQLFTRATELDPDYASAFAGLADCWSYIFLYSERKESVRQQAETAGRRAVELDPESAQAQASYAVALSLGGRAEEAEKLFESAVTLDPELFEAWYFYARHCFVKGETEKAIRLYEQACRVRPDDYQAPLLMAQLYEEAGRSKEARAVRRRGVELVEARLEFHPDDYRAMYMGANGLVALGEKVRGIDWASRARELAPEESMLLYNLGCIYAMAGEPEEALSCLEKAVGLGLSQKGWFAHDGNLDSLRNLPRFQDLMRKLN